MESAVIIRGTFVNKAFVPEEPLPDVEGRAELIVYAQSPEGAAHARPSIYDVFGKAERLRSAEDLDAQLEEERAAWGDA
jgi:hypothetical protein